MSNLPPPCSNFTDRNNFIHWANTTHFNVTRVVEDCQSICTLFYGTGNPDISGIGVMISYYMQCAITSVTGPFLIIIDLALIYLGASRGKRAWVAAFKRIHNTVTATNALFAFSLVTASVARWRQGAFLFEIMFMKKLNQLQASLVILSAGYNLIQGKPQFLKAQVTPSNVVLGVILVILWLVFFSNAGFVPYSTLNIYRKIITGCVERWGYERLGLNATKPEKKQPPTTPLKSFLEFLETVGFMIAFVIGVPVAMGIMGVVGALLGLIVTEIERAIQHIKNSNNLLLRSLQWITHGILWAIVASIYPFALLYQGVRYAWKHHSKPISLVILGVILLSPALPVWILYSVQLDTLRQYMQTANSKSWSDNQWGFGQITAVLLWGPVAMQIIDVLFVKDLREEAAELYEIESESTGPPAGRAPSTGGSTHRPVMPPATTATAQESTAAAQARTSTEAPQPPPYSPASPIVEPATPASPSATAGGPTATSSSLQPPPPPTTTMTQEIDLSLAGNLRKRTTFDSTVENDGESSSQQQQQQQQGNNETDGR